MRVPHSLLFAGQLADRRNPYCFCLLLSGCGRQGGCSSGDTEYPRISPNITELQ